MPNISVGEAFSVAIDSAVKKICIRVGGGGGRGYQDFQSNFFCLTVPKNFVGESFCAVFQKNSGSEKVFR